MPLVYLSFFRVVYTNDQLKSYVWYGDLHSSMVHTNRYIKNYKTYYETILWITSLLYYTYNFIENFNKFPFTYNINLLYTKIP